MKERIARRGRDRDARADPVKEGGTEHGKTHWLAVANIFEVAFCASSVEKTRDGGEAGVRTPVTANPVSRVSCHLQPESHAELAVHAVSLETRREGRNAKDDDTTLERCLN